MAAPGSTQASRAARSSRARSDPWVEVGVVQRTHVPARALPVELWSEETTNLERARVVRLDGDPGEIEFRIVDMEPGLPSRDGRARVRLQLSGMDPKRVRSWSGATVSIRESALESLPDGEYYWRDLIGLECFDQSGTKLGTLHEIWTTGSNDVLIVRGRGRQILVPALREVIREVDPAARVIRFVLPEGVGWEPA